MGTSLGAAIDYLVTQLPALAAAAVPDAIVIDGWGTPPGTDTVSDAMIYIGRDDPDITYASDGTRLYLELGAGRVSEASTISCFIDVTRSSGEQKPARDDALALYDVVVHLVAHDMTLGGILLGGRWAEITGVQLVQPDITGAQTARRRAVVLFKILARNYYSP